MRNIQRKWLLIYVTIWVLLKMEVQQIVVSKILRFLLINLSRHQEERTFTLVEDGNQKIIQIWTCSICCRNSECFKEVSVVQNGWISRCKELKIRALIQNLTLKKWETWIFRMVDKVLSKMRNLGKTIHLILGFLQTLGWDLRIIRLLTSLLHL